MIVTFKKVGPDLSIGFFNGMEIKVQRMSLDIWTISLDDRKTNAGLFHSREAAIRHVQRIADKILRKAMKEVKAQQRSLSPSPVTKDNKVPAPKCGAFMKRKKPAVAAFLGGK